MGWPVNGFRPEDHPRGDAGRFAVQARREGDTTLTAAAVDLEFDDHSFFDAVEVHDICARSDDARSMLDEEDDFAHWFEVPAADVPQNAWVPDNWVSGDADDLEGAIRNYLDTVPGARLREADERERFAAVRRWMEAVGGPDAAFEQSPPLVGMVDGEFRLIDGWHRLMVARHTYGRTRARILLGLPEGG
jgi:hypothetical protein